MNTFIAKQIIAAQARGAALCERAEEGQGMVEYTLILPFVAILVLVAPKFYTVRHRAQVEHRRQQPLSRRRTIRALSAVAGHRSLPCRTPLSTGDALLLYGLKDKGINVSMEGQRSDGETGADPCLKSCLSSMTMPRLSACWRGLWRSAATRCSPPGPASLLGRLSSTDAQAALQHLSPALSGRLAALSPLEYVQEIHAPSSSSCTIETTW